ncbi:MAG: RlmE family RNA methyltransferase [Bacteroidia bacterium]
MPYKPNDHYARKAKQENFAARSIYKLEEIDNRFKIIHAGDYIMDLGASPGSWAQYASKKVGDKGKILGIDLKPVTISLPNAVFVVTDLNELNDDVIHQFINSLTHQLFDCVISDMAPNTTGNKFTDQARSYDLCVLALETAKKFLKPNGNFVCKMFEGEDTMPFRDELKKYFTEVHILRPKSTQSSSKEMFMIGRHKT